jgi:hypothetical protein
VHITLKRRAPNNSGCIAWHSTLMLRIAVDVSDPQPRPLRIGTVASW